MTEFFDRPERLALLRAEAQSWIGTPFRQACRVKGQLGGVDCVNSVCACMEASGLVEPGRAIIPPYSLNHHKNSDVSELMGWFRQDWVGKLVRMVDRDEPFKDGDLCFIKHERAVHHLGLCLDGMLWHTMTRQCFMNTRFENLAILGGEVRTRFRPIAL